MREWGVEAITYLVKSAFHYKFKNPDQGKEVCMCKRMCLYAAIQTDFFLFEY